MNTSENAFFKKAVETSVRLIALALVFGFCVYIFEPFLIPILWGIIIAVGVYPVYKRLKKLCMGNRFFASTTLVILLLILMAFPIFLLTKSFVDGATELSHHLQEHKLVIPPPPEVLKQWPIIGGHIHELWTGFSANLGKALKSFGPSLKPIGLWTVTHLTKVGVDIVMFTISIILAGVLLYYENECKKFAYKLAERLSEDDGRELVEISEGTIKSVTQGILTLAFIQGVLAGIGLVLADVPLAGLWAFLTLILAIVQLPPLFILGPVSLYIFSYGDTTVAIIFLIWSIFLSVVDTPLRAFTMGKNVKIPMAIIFFGAMGGMIQSGIIGLFIGAVVLALGYKFFLFWLNDGGAR